MESQVKAKRNTKRSKTFTLVECALFAAILCICSPITIPIGPVPITMGIFAVMLTGVVLGWKKSLVSVAVFLLIGLCGLPLFSGGNSGFTALAGPTGGYIWSYLIMAVVIGLICQIPCKKRIAEIIIAVFGCVLGIMFCYACGTFQFMHIADYGFKQALAVCVLPFIPFDLIKAVCASVLGVTVKSILKKSRYL